MQTSKYVPLYSLKGNKRKDLPFEDDVIEMGTALGFQSFDQLHLDCDFSFVCRSYRCENCYLKINRDKQLTPLTAEMDIFVNKERIV